jgi:hypothetical protein
MLQVLLLPSLLLSRRVLVLTLLLGVRWLGAGLL